MTELDYLDEIARLAPLTGDDCAVLPRLAAGEEMLVTADQFIEGVHFERRTHEASQAGAKAFLRALSDIAAMGGDPRWYFVAVAFPPWADERWMREFTAGHMGTAAARGLSLAGGDTSAAPLFAATFTVIGSAPRGGALRRSGAKPGDGIYVSGQLGGSALGLATRQGAAWRRHLIPDPRIALGQYLRGRASACIDVSDGLSIDLHRLCKASGVAAALDGPLPVFPRATLQHALHGGEEYELLFTAPDGAAIPAGHDGVALTRIGTIVRGNAGHVTRGGKPLPPLGYDHFRKP